MDPMWSRDGKEIFYRQGSKMMAVPVINQPTFRPGRPEMLWEGEYMFGPSASCGFKGVTTTSYDVSPDGQRFLMIKENDQNLYATRIVVVLNWAEELKQIFKKTRKYFLRTLFWSYS
jgi:Tol biopolymer transport system component